MVKKYKILFKFASRSRIHKFFSALDNIIENISDLDNFCILVSLDIDDITMNNPSSINKLVYYIQKYPEKIIVKFGNSKNKFRRQHSIKNFIADFYCADKRLVIEIDGSQHLDNKEYDQERTWYFESLNIRVIRFWNNEVRENLHGVLTKILTELNM